jgi:hypothetical protein
VRKQTNKWCVFAATGFLLFGMLMTDRVSGQPPVPRDRESPEKKPSDKPGESVRPAADGRQPMPSGSDRRRAPDDAFEGPRQPGEGGRGDRPPGGFGGFPRPGDRRPDGQTQFNPLWRREGGPFGPPPDLKTQDPEMYELESKDQGLERQTEELAQQLRRASRDQREDLKKQLQGLVQKHFDARQARRELQLKRLESELERMRDGMKKRVELREQIIGKRVAELAGEQNEFDF